MQAFYVLSFLLFLRIQLFVPNKIVFDTTWPVNETKSGRINISSGKKGLSNFAAIGA